MARHGMVVKVRPEKLEEYKRLHASTWPEVLALLRSVNIRNFSIFNKDNYLFGYLEYDGTDLQGDLARIAEAPIYKEWLALCDPCQEPLVTRAEGEWWAQMEEIFYMA